MKFNRDEYARQCRRVSNTPLYRASCPIGDELDSLRDSAVEMIADDILDEYMADPALIAEMLLENDYDYKPLQDMCKAISKVMQDKAHANNWSMANALIEFLEEKALSLAEVKIDD